MAQAQVRTEGSHIRFEGPQVRAEASQVRTEAPRESPVSNEPQVLPVIPAEFVELGKKRVEAMMEIQKEFFDTLQEINLAWFERARSAASLNSELVAKLSAARTVPETAEACQECMGKRMEQFVEDSRQLMADSQKIVNLGAKFLANGSASNDSAA